MYTLFLIEDDIQLSKLMKENLERYGYIVHTPQDFKHIEQECIDLQPDLILLDINLPYFDGFYLSRSIRKQSTVPIIIISARNADVDQIMAIESGEDDYLTKPFTFELLQTKVKAAIRREYGEYAKTELTKTYAGDLCIDAQTLVLTYGQQEVELSKNEYRLLKKLIDHQGHFVSRETLIEEVWDSITFIDDNTLTVNISRIKQLLASLGLQQIIKSKRGVGYMLYIPSPTRMEKENE